LILEIVTILLLVFLVARELISFSDSESALRIARFLTVPIIPLLVLFILMLTLITIEI
jgi:hypothetical protein